MNNITEYIKAAKALFDSYDENVWDKAYFDEHSGGYAVFHKDHKFDPTIGVFDIPRGDYEKIASEILVKYGMCVELDSERQHSDEEKMKDGFLNGIPFEIKGMEGNGKNNIINNLKEANKKNVELIVLYYHDKDLFSERQIHESYKSYLRNSKSKRIKQVYYIVDRKIHTLK